MLHRLELAIVAVPRGLQAVAPVRRGGWNEGLHELPARVHDILRALGVRFVLTDTIDGPAPLRGSVTSPGAAGVYLFEFGNVNLGTYSPMRIL